VRKFAGPFPRRLVLGNLSRTNLSYVVIDLSNNIQSRAPIVKLRPRKGSVGAGTTGACGIEQLLRDRGALVQVRQLVMEPQGFFR
jgi:hypothetical protein